MVRRPLSFAAGCLALLGAVTPRGSAQVMRTPNNMVRPPATTPRMPAVSPVPAAGATPSLLGPQMAAPPGSAPPNLNAITNPGLIRPATGVPVSQLIPTVNVNPNFQIAPGLSLPQAAFNTAVLGNALSAVPPYALGFNPYPPAVAGAYSGVGGGGLATSPYGGLGGLSTGGSGGGYGGSLSSGGYGSSGAPGATSPYGGSGGQGTSGGYGGGGYGGSYEDPYAGYLRGVATLTTAQGNYLSQEQQARLSQSQADLSKLDLRRRVADEAVAGRKNWLNPETQRVKDTEAAYTRATREPPLTEVLSGQSLNDLFTHAANLQEKGRLQGVHGPNVPLDEDLLKQVNLAGAGSAGSIALLKDRGRLNWPLVLQSPEYDEARRRLGALVPEALGQARFNNPVDAGLLRQMLADVRRMSDTLQHNVGDVLPSEYVQARRFLGGLEGAVKALRDPNAGNQVNQKWAPQGRNVAELVDFMGKNGLRFAPATPGDEPAYRHLYQRLLAYDAALATAVARPGELAAPAVRRGPCRGFGAGRTVFGGRSLPHRDRRHLRRLSSHPRP